MFVAYADGRAIGHVPPRFNRFLAAERDAKAKVDSVKGDLVSVGVYLQGHASHGPQLPEGPTSSTSWNALRA